MPFIRPTETRQKEITALAKQFILAKCQAATSASTTPLLKHPTPTLDSIKENERAVFLYEVAHEVIEHVKKHYLNSALWQENRLVISIGGTTILLANIAAFLFASQHNDSKAQLDDTVDGTFAFLGIAMLTLALLAIHLSCHQSKHSLEDHVTQYAKAKLPNKKIQVLEQLMALFDTPTSGKPQDDIIALSLVCKQLANTCASVLSGHPADAASEEAATENTPNKAPDINRIFEKMTGITAGTAPTLSA